MSTRYPNLFAACLFAAGSFAALSSGQAQFRGPEDKWPMPTNAIDLNPSGSASQTNQLLVYSWDLDGVTVPVKTLKITNLHNETVFPIFRDGNEAFVPGKSPKTGLYDPFDAIDREYRGYVGYRSGTNNYFGLKPGESILLRIPLVFWNGARMGILTDGKYLVPSGSNPPNPLRFDPNAQMVVAGSEKDPSDKKVIENGIVMWYKGNLNAPALDSPDQLVEWTVRDKVYLSGTAINQRTDQKIPAAEKVTLINYDVSYVDNMFLPAAMEALNVPIPTAPYPPGRKPQPYGWIGAINTSAKLQDKITKFTADKNELLGAYFDGKGWPIYNIPIKEQKIPAAQNIFAQSPFADVRSSYENEAYMLSSGGTIKDLISVIIGGAGTATSGTTITLSSSPADAWKLQHIKDGYTVEVNSNPSPIQPGTKIVGNVDPTTKTVKISKPLVGSEAGAVFKISRPVTDYASTALIKLWFSWAQHYIELKKNTLSQTLTGSVKLEEPILTFSGSQSGLIPGMQVTGPGLPDPNPSLSRGGVIVLEVAQDGRSVLLSQIASANHPIGEGQQYVFKAPQALSVSPAVTGTYVFDFSGDTPNPARDPGKFAERVFLVMASMNQIPKNPDPNVKTPYVNELMNNVVGGNMGFMFEEGKNLLPGAIIVTVVVRDTIKSILRGVTDFTKYSDYATDGSRTWYPDPKVGTGKKTFNVFNLDPFVRFVHVDLGFSGYGFSLDDDTADVGAGEATKLLMTIGGPPPGNPGPVVGIITAKSNPNEWTIQAPYGTVKGKGAWDPKLTEPIFLNISNASNTTPIVVTSTNHGLGNGEKVTLSEVGGNTAANNTFNITNVSKDTFELAGSAGNAAYTGGGKWTLGPQPYIILDPKDIDDIYWRIKGDDRVAGFQGAFVSTEGVTPTKLLRVTQLGNAVQGQLMLSGTLTIKKTNRPLPKGNYTWTFSGTLPK